MFFATEPHFDDFDEDVQKESQKNVPDHQETPDLSKLSLSRDLQHNPALHGDIYTPEQGSVSRTVLVLGEHDEVADEAEALAAVLPGYLKDTAIHYDHGTFTVVVRTPWVPSNKQFDALEGALHRLTDIDVELDWQYPLQGMIGGTEPHEEGQSLQGGKAEPTPSADDQKGPDKAKPVDVEQYQNVYNSDRIQEAIESTLPDGVELVRPTFYHSPLEDTVLSFAILKVHMTQGLTPEIEAWRENLEITYRLGIILQPATDVEDLDRILAGVADQDGIIRDRAVVQGLMDTIHGMPYPDGTDIAGTPVEPAQFVDLTEEYGIAVDPPGARDIDDVLMARELSRDKIEVMVSYVDAAWQVRPGSELDRYVEHAGSSLYAESSTVSLLGEDFSFDKVSLLEGDERYAFTVRMVIDRDGNITESDVFRSLVKNHAQLSFAKADKILKGKQHEASDLLETLQDAATRLRSRRMAKGNTLILQSETGSDQIIEEAMIHAKHCIADFATKHKIPLLYKVHTVPAYKVRKNLAKEVRKAGLDVSADYDFKDPVAFREMISSLRDRKQYRLLFRILDVYMQRASYSVTKSRHHGLDISAYTEIKARHEAGLLNQRQLARFLDGDEGLNKKQLMSRQGGVNERVRNYYDTLYRYISYERIEKGLARLGQSTQARIKRVAPDEVQLRIKGMRAKCVLIPEPGQNFRRGKELSLIMEGFDVERNAFVFRMKDDSPAGKKQRSKS